jgi:hypothetical protein
MATTFLSNRGEMRKTYGEHSIYASRKISLILAKQFQRRRLPLSDWIKKKSVLKSIYSMVSSLSNAKLLLFLPMPVAVAVQRFVLFSDFTRVNK